MSLMSYNTSKLAVLPLGPQHRKVRMVRNVISALTRLLFMCFSDCLQIQILFLVFLFVNFWLMFGLIDYTCLLHAPLSPFQRPFSR